MPAEISFTSSASAPPGRPTTLTCRKYRLLAAHRDAWDASLSSLTERREYRRGFVEGVTLSVTTFLEHAPRLYALAPIR